MAFLRLINIEHHCRKGRLSSMAFRASDKGISVIDKECAEYRSQSVCNHVRTHYSKTAGTPIVFWEIPDNTIPADCEAVHSINGTDLWCHYDIIKWTKPQIKEAEDTIKKLPLTELKICVEAEARQAVLADFPILA